MSLLDDLMTRVEQHQRDVWTQTREGRYSAERALLERDVAEVERHARQLARLIEDMESRAMFFDAMHHAKTTYAAYDMEIGGFGDAARSAANEPRSMLADCRRWLQETA